MSIEAVFRDLAPADLAELDWTGGAEHLRAIGEVLPLTETGAVEYVVGELGNGRLVAAGGLDLRPDPAVGVL